MSVFSKVVGTGSYLPERVVSNDTLVAELAERGIEASAEWVETRTGIRSRHLATGQETTTYMAAAAAKAAIEAASCSPKEVELIVLATSTADQIFPSTACGVQASLAANKAIAFDIQAVCSGFVYALTVANSMIRSGQVKNALVIGSEVFSRILDWNDRRTCVLFGDGAGAVFLKASEEPGILGCSLYADGRLDGILHANGRIENGQIVGDPFLRMEGQAVFKQAVSVLGKNALEVLERTGLSKSDLDFVVPHQANLRILQALAKKLSLTDEQVIVTLDRHGNTSAASVPLALDNAVRENRIKQGHKVLLQGVGGGFTWGSVLVSM